MKKGGDVLIKRGGVSCLRTGGEIIINIYHEWFRQAIVTATKTKRLYSQRNEAEPLRCIAGGKKLPPREKRRASFEQLTVND